MQCEKIIDEYEEFLQLCSNILRHGEPSDRLWLDSLIRIMREEMLERRAKLILYDRWDKMSFDTCGFEARWDALRKS